MSTGSLWSIERWTSLSHITVAFSHRQDLMKSAQAGPITMGRILGGLVTLREAAFDVLDLHLIEPTQPTRGAYQVAGAAWKAARRVGWWTKR